MFDWLRDGSFVAVASGVSLKGIMILCREGRLSGQGDRRQQLPKLLIGKKKKFEKSCERQEYGGVDLRKSQMLRTGSDFSETFLTTYRRINWGISPPRIPRVLTGRNRVGCYRNLLGY